jgi:hypothetical protein
VRKYWEIVLNNNFAACISFRGNGLRFQNVFLLSKHFDDRNFGKYIRKQFFGSGNFHERRAYFGRLPNFFVPVRLCSVYEIALQVAASCSTANTSH